MYVLFQLYRVVCCFVKLMLGRRQAHARAQASPCQGAGKQRPIGVKLREGEEFTQQTKKDFCEKIKGRL
jgi:hypothetical protein